MKKVRGGHLRTATVSPSQFRERRAATSPRTSVIVLTALCVRIAAALLAAHTFFQPDEYFQALEPAHRVVFGYGHLTWEWRVHPPVRSALYPMLFVPWYWALKRLRWDGGALLIWTPKVVQGLLASVTDVAVCRLARNVLGERYVFATFLLSLSSLFHLQALSRTLSNSLETSLTTLALSHWPFSSIDGDPSSQQLVKPLLMAAVTCMIRPTSAILWLFLVLELSWRLRRDVASVMQLWRQVCMVGLTACAFLFLLDSWYFGTFTFTPLNFLITNLSPVSTFYGRNPWHYYLTQGIPILCNVTAPFFFYGVWQGLRTRTPGVRRLICLVVWTVSVYSFPAHKEWRFIHPLLPAMHVIASKPVVDNHKWQVTKPATVSRLWRWRTTTPGALAWCGGALVVAPYLLLIQSRAQIAVMHHLRGIPVDELRSVGFLMPCHSTPWQAYLHRPHLTEHSLWALGCEPPLGGQNLKEYQDQSDVFYASPIRYLETRFPADVDPEFPASQFPASVPGVRETMDEDGSDGGEKDGLWAHEWPSHLVMFGVLLESDGVRPLLETLGYREEWNGWNGWEQDVRRRGGVRVWRWQGQDDVQG